MKSVSFLLNCTDPAFTAICNGVSTFSNPVNERKNTKDRFSSMMTFALSVFALFVGKCRSAFQSFCVPEVDF